MTFWFILVALLGILIGFLAGALIVKYFCDKEAPIAGDLYLTDETDLYADLDELTLKSVKNGDMVRIKIRIINTSYSGDNDPRRRN